MAEMSNRTDLWLGTSLGTIKGICLNSTLLCSNYLSGRVTLSETNKQDEMLRICRGSDGDKRLYVALRCGVVLVFSCSRKKFTDKYVVTGGEEMLVGVGRHGSVLITCTDRGSLCFTPLEREKWTIDVGNHACVMAASPSQSLQVATGGKENPLKIWDGQQQSQEPLFTAKNVRPDKLDLRIPVWVKEVGFTPDSGPQPVVATGTAYGHVRLYDTRAQRRPVYSKQYGMEPITALDLTPDGRYYVVGNNVGELARFDLRKGARLGQYKGFGGSVCAVRCGLLPDTSSTVLAACGMDRYLRVYQMEQPKLLHELYLKLQCRCLLFDTSSPMSSGESHTPLAEEGSEEEEDEEEDVWKAMETVGDEPTSPMKRCRPMEPALTNRSKKELSKTKKRKTAQTDNRSVEDSIRFVGTDS